MYDIICMYAQYACLPHTVNAGEELCGSCCFRCLLKSRQVKTRVKTRNIQLKVNFFRLIYETVFCISIALQVALKLQCE